MSEINNGIQVTGGTFKARVVAAGNNAQAFGEKSGLLADSSATDLTTPSKQARNTIFIAYSHDDSRWLERIRLHTRPIIRDHSFAIWDTSRIGIGADWRDALNEAIQTARIFILLISSSFLASDFVMEYELPKVLQRAQQEGALIIPVIISPCRLAGSGIEFFQPINEMEKPLQKMRAAEQEETMVKIVDTIVQQIQASE